MFLLLKNVTVQLIRAVTNKETPGNYDIQLSYIGEYNLK